MRNRYRVALRTYRRPAFLAVLIAAGGWIVMLGLMISLSRVLHQVPDAPEPVQNQMREAMTPQVREVQLTVVSGFIGFFSFILLSFMGTGLSIHLKAMLGAPASLLVPGLRQTHLTLAGLIIACVIGVLALAICCGPGLGVSPLAVVAYLLAMLAIPAFLAHWRPEPLVVMVIVMPGLVVTRQGRAFIWPPSTQVTIVVLAVAIGCLVSVGMRLGRFNEEMREFHLRILAGMSPGATRVLWPAPLGDIRYWRRVSARTPVSLLWRAPALACGLGHALAGGRDWSVLWCHDRFRRNVPLAFFGSGTDWLAEPSLFGSHPRCRCAGAESSVADAGTVAPAIAQRARAGRWRGFSDGDVLVLGIDPGRGCPDVLDPEAGGSVD